MRHQVNPNRGILHFDPAQTSVKITRHLPSARLRHLIQHYWFVEWYLEDQPPYTQEVLQHPGVNIIFEQGSSYVCGIESRKAAYTLQGKGLIAGILYRPGAFHGYISESMSELVDRKMDISKFFPFDAETAEKGIFESNGLEERVDHIERLLCSSIPEPDDKVDELNTIIGAIMEDRTITTVDLLENRFNVSKRTLQRMFKQYLGVSPKWVIQRYRMHEASEAIENGADIATVALELGYFDQAHFSKDFKAIVGASPHAYRRGH
ncbi:helix-turn-helix domain-containing protein [Paenibacillus sp. XY044]|uniref:AraC family transcriptional regulator n=1 Tax=Paenibacillus sp. XY044 TaxID=2026089 RepID=UPI000B98F8F4|nr:helix-turn-helix domain-containing protein [Paenibacillus sp. XY044]OZB94249.1 AraC family transcriptional regulator [Paenibacillus sp. XY044]